MRIFFYWFNERPPFFWTHSTWIKFKRWERDSLKVARNKRRATPFVLRLFLKAVFEPSRAEAHQLLSQKTPSWRVDQVPPSQHYFLNLAAHNIQTPSSLLKHLLHTTDPHTRQVYAGTADLPHILHMPETSISNNIVCFFKCSSFLLAVPNYIHENNHIMPW